MLIRSEMTDVAPETEGHRWTFVQAVREVKPEDMKTLSQPRATNGSGAPTCQVTVFAGVWRLASSGLAECR